MTNQLGMAEQHSIITLWKQGWSHRRIARTLGIHRATVSRYVRLASERIEEAHGPPTSTEAKPASRVGDSKPAISINRDTGKRRHWGHAIRPFRRTLEPPCPPFHKPTKKPKAI